MSEPISGIPTSDLTTGGLPTAESRSASVSRSSASSSSASENVGVAHNTPTTGDSCNSTGSTASGNVGVAHTESWLTRHLGSLHYLSGILPKAVSYIGQINRGPGDNGPSAARTYGGIIFLTVVALQIMVITTMCWKVLRLDPATVNSLYILPIYTKLLSQFMLWGSLFDCATALSLYGINVWRFVASIRTGQAVAPDADDPTTLPVASTTTTTIPALPVAATATSGD